MLKPLLFRLAVATLSVAAFGAAAASDLDTIRQRGVLRHLGVPYANFVTGSGDGLDVELMQRFAGHLGVRYEFVETDWNRAFGDLTGKLVKPNGDLIRQVPVRGDVIANGMTVLPWREKLVDYSEPTFPSAVWLVARADSKTVPIAASGSRENDIAETKARIGRSSLLVMHATSLDPTLYDLHNKGLRIRKYTRSTNLNEMVPAIVNGDAELTLLDVPDALIAFDKWPGKIKVIGPISDEQTMGVGFRKSSPELRRAFNEFLATLKADGTYARLARKYYPSVFRYFPEFFASAANQANGRVGRDQRAAR